jgi:hypothetical protein
MRCVLRVETWEREDPVPTFAEITALTSPEALTPSPWERIRRWMILRMFTMSPYPA